MSCENTEYRKGYFYRSYELLRAPPSLPTRMEPNPLQKNEPQIQITRLAPSSSKISGLFKTRLTHKRYIHDNMANFPTSYQGDFASDSGKTSECGPHLRLHQCFKGVCSLDNTNNELISLQFDRENGNETCLDWSNRQTTSENLSSRHCINADLASEKMKKNDPTKVDDHLRNLDDEISINKVKISEAYDVTNYLNIIENCYANNRETEKNQELEDFAETPNTCDNICGTNCVDPISQEPKFLYNMQTIQPSSEPHWFFSSFHSNLNLAKQFSLHSMNDYEAFHQTLMADIDLHMELENYLKAIYSNEAVNEKFNQENINETVDEYLERDCQSKCIDLTDETEIIQTEDHDPLINEDDISLTPENQPKIYPPSLGTISPSSAPEIDTSDKNQAKKAVLKRIKSENDKTDAENAMEFDTYIKRTYGETSFRLSSKKWESNIENKSVTEVHKVKTWENFLTKLYIPKINIPLFDNYGKINTINRETYYLNLIFNKEHCSDNHAEHYSKIKSKIIDSHEPMLIMSKETHSAEKLYMWGNHHHQQIKRNSSVEELLKIYNSILGEHKKNLRFQKEQSSQKATDTLLSFINVLLKAKKNNSDTIQVAQLNNLGSSQSCTFLGRDIDPDNKQKTYLSLQEYVRMVQKMLSSALSIQQISMLNEIAATLQEKPATNTNNKITKKSTKLKSTKKISEIKNSLPRDVPPAQRKIPKKIFRKINPKKNFSETPVTDSSTSQSYIAPNKVKDLELSSPEAFKRLLKSHFQLQKSNFRCQKKKPDTKLLVTVKLRGEKIIVNAVNKIQNENTLPDEYQSKEISDLIIESVHEDQLDELLVDWKNNSELSIKKPIQQFSISAKKHPIEHVSSLKIEELKPVIKKNDIKLFKTLQKLEKVKSHDSNGTVPIGDFFASKMSSTFLNTPPKFFEKNYPYNLYEYDQQKLKAQHPIEAIMESSESKIDEIYSESSIKKENNSAEEYSNCNDNHQGLRDHKQERQKLGKCLTSLTSLPREVAILPRNRPANVTQLNRTMSHVLEVDRNECVNGQARKEKIAKSVEDTSFRKIRKNISGVRKNLKKKTQVQSCNVLCYLFSRKSNDKKIRNKKSGALSECKPECEGFNKKATKMSKTTLEKTKHSVKKPLPKKSDKIEKKKTIEKLEKNRCEKRSSVDQMLLEKKKETKDDDGTVKFLYNEHTHSSSVSQDSTEFEEPRKFSKTQDLIPLYLFDEAVAKPLDKPNIGSNNSKALPVFIYTPRKDDLENSFPSLMTRSESFLKSQSAFVLSKSKIKSLFKSYSDMKFIPGKEADNSAELEQPFVTFVLTPKQKATAGVPSNQVQVVLDGNLQMPEEDTLIKFEADRIIEKKNLHSIEEFIQTLSKCVIKNESKAIQKTVKKENRPGKSNDIKKIETKTILTRPKQVEAKRYKAPCPRYTTSAQSEKSDSNIKRNVEVHQKQTNLIFDSKDQGKTKISNVNENSLSTDTQTTENPETFNGKQNFKRQTKPVEKIPKDITSPEHLQIFDETLKSLSNTETNKSNNPQSDSLDYIIMKEVTNDTIKKATTGVSKNVGNEETINMPKPKVRNPSPNNDSSSNKPPKTCKHKISCNAKKSQSAEVNVVLKQKTEKRDSSLQRPCCTGKRESTPEKHKIQSTDKPIGKKALLSRTLSVYFDAEEDDKIQLPKVTETTKTIRKVSSDKLDDDFLLTSMSSFFVAENQLIPDYEEKIVDKLLENLQMENVATAIILLETFFKKLQDDDNDREKIQISKVHDVLESIEHKTKSLMERMERNGWSNVLFRLNEIAKVFSERMDDESIFRELNITDSLDYLEKQVSNAKKLMSTIQMLIKKTLLTEKKTSKSVFECTTNETKLSNKFITAIGDSFRYLKNKIISNDETLNSVPREDEAKEIELFQTEVNCSKKSSLQSLKMQIRQNRLRLHYLMNENCGPIFPDVQNLKNQVAEKLEFLERTLSTLDVKTIERSLEENSNGELRKLSPISPGESIFKMTKKTPLTNLTGVCKNYLPKFVVLSFFADDSERNGTIEGRTSSKKLWNTEEGGNSSFNNVSH